MDAWTLPRTRLGALIRSLRDRGYEVIGPSYRDGAIVLDRIERDDDLPNGKRDVQGKGTYRVEDGEDARAFAFAVGPHSFKRWFHVPVERLYRVEREGKRLRFVPEPVTERKLALFGARGCDLAALTVLDRVLLGDRYRDERYAKRRSDVAVIAVHCDSPSDNCFCHSMGTGPRARGPWDLALTELLDSRSHRFVVESGSALGHALVRELGLESASILDRTRAAEVPIRAARMLKKELKDARDLPTRLGAALESPKFDGLDSRCLSCANCTLACPTCFCTTIEDRTSLDGSSAERHRRLDSCFVGEHSYLHGGSVRQSTHSRYRQWLTHKLMTWVDQFGSSGCVGCGRCITWCPVGIDLTEEARAVSESRSSTHRLE